MHTAAAITRLYRDASATTTYPGGKAGAGVYQTLINLMPPHIRYIEPFLGAGAIMRMKRPAERNIGMDLDGDLIDRWNSGHYGAFPEPPYTFTADCGLDFLHHLVTGRRLHGDLIYCDPPYMHSTRTRSTMYKYEMTDADHSRLLVLLRSAASAGAMVMVSGYMCALYADMLKDWHATSYQAMTRGGRPATEWVWCSFPPPVALHDYGYLGKDYRERERITRKRKRWEAKFAKMPILERQAIMAALTAITKPKSGNKLNSIQL